MTFEQALLAYQKNMSDRAWCERATRWCLVSLIVVGPAGICLALVTLNWWVSMTPIAAWVAAWFSISGRAIILLGQAIDLYETMKRTA